MENKISDDLDQIYGLKSIFEAIKIVRLKYNTEFLDQDQINYTYELFKTKSPIAVKISDDLIKTIESKDIYQKVYYHVILFFCVFHLNHLTKGIFADALNKLSPVPSPDK